MRVALIGQAAFAQRVLDGLRERGHEIGALYCPPDRPGRAADPARERALEVGIPVRQHGSLKGEKVAEEVRALGADLGVLAYVTQIVPPAVIDAPRLGSICFHPSLLPRYRGGSAIPWQIIKGETRSGVTVFWTDPGIDTGPILLQKEAEIAADDTAGTLYYGRLFELGIAAVLEAVELIRNGVAPRIPQEESLATYDPLLTDEHARIDWNRPVAELYDLVRGCDPQPGAWVPHGEGVLRFFDARPVARQGVEPGRIAESGADGIVVGAGGGCLRFGRLRVGGRKIPAVEASRELGLAVGSLLA